MKRAAIIFFLIIFFSGSTVTCYTLYAQDESKETTLEFKTWKFSDGKRNLIAKITASTDSGEVIVKGVTVNFYNGSQNEEELLGNGVTASDGKGICTLDSMVRLRADKEGFIRFIARFPGNDQYGACEAELKLKDARIEIEFAEVDSVKKILYSGKIISAAGKEEPLANTDIFFYVPRMFSMLKILDGWLEEGGSGASDFPLDLIGDSTGVVSIFARIEDNADFGNLEASAKINWALKKHGEAFEGPQRELWTPIAPMWMIITLIIMLSGVWGHYFYAIIQLILINKAGKSKEEEGIPEENEFNQ
jgi:hypothetical protein